MSKDKGYASGNETREEDAAYQLKVWYHAAARPRYPKFRLSEGERFLFRSLADAELQIARTVASGRRIGVPVPYCFLVEEIPFGRQRRYGESQAWWRYDGTGRRVVSSSVSEMVFEGGLEPFFGRPPESCPVRPGDIVEVTRGDEVVLEIVLHLPPAPERVLRMYADTALRPPMDFSDDSYITLDGTISEGQDTYMHAHDHPHAKDVFPAGRKIPDRVRERLEACLRRVEAEIGETVVKTGPLKKNS